MQLSLVLSDMTALFQTNVGSRGKHDGRTSAPHNSTRRVARPTDPYRDREGERAKGVMLGEACSVHGAMALVVSFVCTALRFSSSSSCYSR